MVTYQSELTRTFGELAKQKEVVFLGQGLVNGDRVYGTMSEVPTNKCMELPCAENLIMGVATGLALKGLRPVVVFQRMDFILLAADQIINHLALMPKMSGGQFKLPVLIRAIVGSSDRNFDVGEQHRKDFSDMFREYLSVYTFRRGMDIFNSYTEAYKEDAPALLVEYKDNYKEEIKNVSAST